MMVGGEPELCLRLGIGDDRQSGNADSAKACCRDARYFEIKEKCQEKQQQQQNKQITIFYKGQICVCDITEIQAKAIITMANQAMGNTANKNGKHTSIDTNNNHYKRRRVIENSCNATTAPTSRTPQSISPHGSTVNPPPQLLNSGLTMKRSLQRFLQKRKARLTAAAAPYDACIKELLSSSIS